MVINYLKVLFYVDYGEQVSIIVNSKLIGLNLDYKFTQLVITVLLIN
jgi:hypothetical protein